MKATELRIGNLIEFRHQGIFIILDFHVTGFDKDSKEEIYMVRVLTPDRKEIMLIKNVNELIPIPLTEEWLLKYGFELRDKVNGGYVKQINFPHQKEYLYCSKKGIVALWSDPQNREFGIMNDCEYVHQLQNLYFALTGNELEIK